MDNLKRSHSSGKGSLGKYKGDKSKGRSKSSSSRQKQYDCHGSEHDATPLVIPCIKQVDLAKILPKYTTVLSRTTDDSVEMEELDEVQQDFERLLSSCAVRQRLLKSEIDWIDRVEDRKDKRGKSHDKPNLLKRKRTDEKSKHKDSRGLPRIIKPKSTLPVGTYLPGLRFDKPKEMPKHDDSNRYGESDRFWLSIDQYCADVTKDDVNFLDDLIKEMSQDVDIKIPNVGEHYSNEWSENAIHQEQANGAMKALKKPPQTTLLNDMKKNGLNSMINDSFPSPLTQRFLDTLLEENVLKTIPTTYENVQPSDYLLKANNGPRSGMCLDKRLRKELIEQGILDPENIPKSYPPDDEILADIKKNLTELASVNKLNVAELTKLRTVIARDLRRQEVKSALDKLDSQVQATYEKIQMARQKYLTDMHRLPKPDPSEYEQEVTTLIKQRYVLHSELQELTDFTLLE